MSSRRPPRPWSRRQLNAWKHRLLAAHREGGEPQYLSLLRAEVLPRCDAEQQKQLAQQRETWRLREAGGEET